MYKLNLHAHTIFSDGRNTILEMASEYKRQHFPVAVITDHVYSEEHRFSINREQYSLQLDEAAKASELLNFPIIVGAEFTLDRMEEVVVIGQTAVAVLLDMRKARLDNGIDAVTTLEDLAFIKDNYDCWISLCHPGLREMIDGSIPFLDMGGHKNLDAYELINHGQNFFKNRPIPAEFEGLTPVSNSDAHSINHIGMNYNFTTEKITCEKELFQYIKTNGTFKLFNFYEEVINE